MSASNWKEINKQTMEAANRRRSAEADAEYHKKFWLRIFLSRQDLRTVVSSLVVLGALYYIIFIGEWTNYNDWGKTDETGIYWWAVAIFGAVIWKFTRLFFGVDAEWSALHDQNESNKAWLSPVGKVAYDNIMELDALAKMHKRLDK